MKSYKPKRYTVDDMRGVIIIAAAAVLIVSAIVFL